MQLRQECKKRSYPAKTYLKNVEDASTRSATADDDVKTGAAQLGSGFLLHLLLVPISSLDGCTNNKHGLVVVVVVVVVVFLALLGEKYCVALRFTVLARTLRRGSEHDDRRSLHGERTS
jgi:hypothetical protein